MSLYELSDVYSKMLHENAAFVTTQSVPAPGVVTDIKTPIIQALLAAGYAKDYDDGSDQTILRKNGRTVTVDADGTVTSL